jgi:hypothetical protein
VTEEAEVIELVNVKVASDKTQDAESTVASEKAEFIEEFSGFSDVDGPYAGFSEPNDFYFLVKDVEGRKELIKEILRKKDGSKWRLSAPKSGKEHHPVTGKIAPLSLLTVTTKNGNQFTIKIMLGKQETPAFREPLPPGALIDAEEGVGKEADKVLKMIENVIVKVTADMLPGMPLEELREEKNRLRTKLLKLFESVIQAKYQVDDEKDILADIEGEAINDMKERLNRRQKPRPPQLDTLAS